MYEIENFDTIYNTLNISIPRRKRVRALWNINTDIVLHIILRGGYAYNLHAETRNDSRCVVVRL